MTAEQAANKDVLRRKATVGRRVAEARGVSPEKALNRALARAAQTQWNLALVTRDIRIKMHDQAGCEAALGAGGLILLLEGPEEARGFAMVDAALVSGLTEVQTFGLISASLPEERGFTETDAAMVAPLLDQALRLFETLMQGTPLERQIAGFRFGARLGTARIAATLMEAPLYRVFSAEVDLAGGRRVGPLLLAFPEGPPQEEAAEDNEPAAPGHRDLMLSLPVPIDAVLCRVTLSLREVEAFRPGDRLDLPRDALRNADLRAAGGHRVARGVLGQLNGQRAVRIGATSGAGAVSLPRAAGGDGAELEDGPTSASGPQDAGSGSQERGAPEAEPALPDLPPLEFDAVSLPEPRREGTGA